MSEQLGPISWMTRWLIQLSDKREGGVHGWIRKLINYWTRRQSISEKGACQSICNHATNEKKEDPQQTNVDNSAHLKTVRLGPIVI
jgi:hypothetical protein